MEFMVTQDRRSAQTNIRDMPTGGKLAKAVEGLCTAPGPTMRDSAERLGPKVQDMKGRSLRCEARRWTCRRPPAW